MRSEIRRAACAFEQASELSSDDVLQHLAVEGQIGDDLLQFGVLVL